MCHSHSHCDGGKEERGAGTHQGTQQIHSLQDELLVSDPGHPQILQLLVGDPQQLVSPDFLPLKSLDVLLETVIQAWEEGTHTQYNLTR